MQGSALDTNIPSMEVTASTRTQAPLLTPPSPGQGAEPSEEAAAAVAGAQASSPLLPTPASLLTPASPAHGTESSEGDGATGVGAPAALPTPALLAQEASPSEKMVAVEATVPTLLSSPSSPAQGSELSEGKIAAAAKVQPSLPTPPSMAVGAESSDTKIVVDVKAQASHGSAPGKDVKSPHSHSPVTSGDFVRRLAFFANHNGGVVAADCLGDDGNANDSLGSTGSKELCSQSAAERMRLEVAIAQEVEPIEGCGNDEAARALSYFCREHGGDARTLRTIVDVLMQLAPPLQPVDLLFCLTALVPRFAPIALLLEAGTALVRLCRLFEQLLLFHDPEVAFLLRRAKLGAEIYCAPWLLTAHAAGLADSDAALRIWDGWLDRGESLDPVFLGLARLLLCHDELLLCGPVPELAQLLQSSLGAKAHVQPRVVDEALRRAADLKATTPLTFLRRLQDALLKPLPEDAAAGEPATAGESSSTSRRKEQRAVGPAVTAASATTMSPTGPLARVGAWLPGRRSTPEASQPAPSSKATPLPSLVCMRVEPQDVMMMETVKARHLKKKQNTAMVVDGAAVAEVTAEEQTSPGPSVPNIDDGCRLLPKLIDVRPNVEARNHGVRGSRFVDVVARKAASEFVVWVQQRKEEASAFGLQPVHVLMTSDGVLNVDQQKFVKAVLEGGVPAICILGGGYEGLKPFFLDKADGSAEQNALAERAQEAKELLQKGIGGLRDLWQKAPTREDLFERIAPQGGPQGGGLNRSKDRQSATFSRAPLPPNLAMTSGSASFECVDNGTMIAGMSSPNIGATTTSPTSASVVSPGKEGDAAGSGTPTAPAALSGFVA